MLHYIQTSLPFIQTILLRNQTILLSLIGGGILAVGRGGASRMTSEGFFEARQVIEPDGITYLADCKGGKPEETLRLVYPETTKILAERHPRRLPEHPGKMEPAHGRNGSNCFKGQRLIIIFLDKRQRFPYLLMKNLMLPGSRQITR